MKELLKGNFKVKKTVTIEDDEKKEETDRSISKKLRSAALASIGGSMVYMERTDLTWDGDEK